MQTIYEQLGADNLELLVERFYEQVLKNETISPLFKTDMQLVKQKQYQFLTQFFGGPNLYSQEYGHPRMRLRHMPHAITGEAAMEWLKCMNIAVNSLEIEEQLKNTVFNSFPRIAAHMVNRMPEE